MAVGDYVRSVHDLLEQRNDDAASGRQRELASLLSVVDADGPVVTFVHGLGGMGKSTLLDMFARAAEHRGVRVLPVDCAHVEPTPRGIVRALAAALDADLDPVDEEEVFRRLAPAVGPVVLVLDTFEAFGLADTWLRQQLLPRLPAGVRLVIAGRHRPNPAWKTSTARGAPVQTMLLGPLDTDAALALLGRIGVDSASADRIHRLVGGHPLLLQVAGAAVAERPGIDLDDVAVSETIEAVTNLYLADLDPTTRHALDAASVVRRVTEPLLAAMLPPGSPVPEAIDRLRSLPFVRSTAVGLAVHETLQPVVAASLRASDPVRHARYRQAAWSELRNQLRTAGRPESWRYTADMLFLIGNPVVREAFFPTRGQSYVVEPSRAHDADALDAITASHEPPAAADRLDRWWKTFPASFRVARAADGFPVGFYCMVDSAEAGGRLAEIDEVAPVWFRHLDEDPVADDEDVLFLGRWLTHAHGELPDEVQAALWLDIKGAYTVRRPHLRRLYTVVRDLQRWAPIVTPLGFRPIHGGAVDVDGTTLHAVVLDFGAGSVDSWLAGLVADELGVIDGLVLDRSTLSVDAGHGPIHLSRLEFGVLENLMRRDGRPASRSDLLREVWGTPYDGGSNVVAAVVRTLRHKLGEHAAAVETVPNAGYRFRRR